MAENKNIEIGGRLHSIATGNVVTGANEVLDDDKNKKQSDINAETDAALEDRYTKEQTYSKSELNNMITTPNQQYVSVMANSQTTAATDVLPATGSANTVYRVGNWDGSQFDESVYSEYAWNGSQYVHLSTKTKIGEVFDISAYHATGGELAKYADLAAALDSNNGGGVPQSLQEGGMSVKYVRTSDNKYVQFRCMADDFTTDTTQWAIAEEGVYVENPEFVKVYTDNDNKILWAIKADGDIYFGVGVPTQIKNYVKTYGYNKSAIDALLNAKVDKVTDKALIDAEFAIGINYVENVEFAAVYLDNDRKILWGIKNDGDFYFGYGVPTQIKTYVISHMAEIKAELEAELQDETRRAINAENELGTFEDNPEFLKAITDNEKKIIEGIKADGTKFVGGNLQVKGKILNKDLQDKINNLSSNKVDKVKDKGLIQNDVSESLSAIEDVEGRSEISIDSERKIVSYRDPNGVKHENVGIAAERLITNHLNLSESGMTEFQQSLINSGFNPTGVSDWSNKKELHINEPYCAIVNFSGIDAMPTTKTDDAHAYLEFWDMNGNYFKKEVIANAQGRSTMQHPKKNISIDICNNNDWDDDDTFNLQIGDWVPQDSFHLKAFYNDPFRCICPVAYKLNDEILKTRGEYNDYVWKRGLFDLSDITATSTGCTDAKEAVESWNTNARCFPMGFPCIVYLNGAFYGIFSWQLKKHRDNYMMSKKKTKHIHLDGAVNLDNILNANGDKTQIVWTTNSPEGIEIRNPKPKKKKDGWDLTMMDGTTYDADANGGELIDDTAAVWDVTNQSHVKSAEVKQYILNLSKVIPALTEAYTIYQASSQTAEDKAAFKEVFETYFDVDNLIDYLILSDVLANFDGFRQNVQWITYNGVKWYLCAYDLDCTMGNWWELNNTIVSPGNAHRDYAQFQYLPIFYNDELEARYKELRDRDIISVNHICGLVEDWLKRVGAKETFEKEWEKWSGFIKNDNIHRLYKWLQVSISNMDSVYNYNQI